MERTVEATAGAPRWWRQQGRTVNPTKPLHDLVDAGLRGRLIAQVDDARKRLHAESLHLGRHSVYGAWQSGLRLRRLGGDDHVAASPRERERTLAANATARTGDDGDAVL